MAALAQGDPKQAWNLVIDSVHLFQALGDKASIAECFERLGKVAIVLKNPDFGVRLFGAADALRESIGVPSSIAARTEQEQFHIAAQAEMSVEEINDSYAAGREISYVQAIAELAAAAEQYATK
jgi:hypothetical protein